jgi:isoquinoline 1-oxidoreductase alpha subunit
VDGVLDIGFPGGSGRNSHCPCAAQKNKALAHAQKWPIHDVNQAAPLSCKIVSENEFTMTDIPARRVKPKPVPPVAASALEKTIPLRINGKDYFHNGDPKLPLLWYLRDVLRLTGAKYGCDSHVCGACTVLVDGKAQHACAVPVKALAQREVLTIEGLAGKDALHPLQESWIAEDAIGCGYCQPGQIMAAAALLKRKPKPSDADIDAMTNLCRCGTYPRIRAAITRTAAGRKA